MGEAVNGGGYSGGGGRVWGGGGIGRGGIGKGGIGRGGIGGGGGRILGDDCTGIFLTIFGKSEEIKTVLWKGLVLFAKKGNNFPQVYL